MTKSNRRREMNQCWMFCDPVNPCAYFPTLFSHAVNRWFIRDNYLKRKCIIVMVSVAIDEAHSSEKFMNASKNYRTSMTILFLDSFNSHQHDLPSSSLCFFCCNYRNRSGNQANWSKQLIFPHLPALISQFELSQDSFGQNHVSITSQ